ncbi:hypothetical protein CEP52_015908 [Fusarium oligoseptatum]|uniref:Gfd2/YDR514C-like C-terminal domain-containing protein n=1 Tax=Fusarium oligoseptatum TaxID=2604345 RepID=A0A428S8N0_9HYPO|nr:hypothetical protein CEP52_015908 [Fusarium oligoseptatum]
MSAMPPPGRAESVPDWMAGLSSETFLKSRGVLPFRSSPPQAQAPDSTARVLPQFNEKSQAFMPVEHDKITATNQSRKLDGRTLTPETSSAREPPQGTAGKKLQTLMEQHHWIVEEFRGHWGQTCPDKEHKPAPYSFAFGKSELVPESKLGHRLNNVFMYLCKLNRTAEEKEQGKLRKVVFLTWDSRLVEMTIQRLGFMWFKQPNVELWDLQKRFVCPGPRIEFALQTLGIRFVDQFFGNIARCSGNLSMFLLQMFLSTFYMADGMRNAFVRGQNLPWLPYSWTGVDLGQVNVPPGQLPVRRPLEYKNDNDVPQKSDPKIWP